MHTTNVVVHLIPGGVGVFIAVMLPILYKILRMEASIRTYTYATVKLVMVITFLLEGLVTCTVHPAYAVMYYHHHNN